MKGLFKGWGEVAYRLEAYADHQETISSAKGEEVSRLNRGQRASVRAIAKGIQANGVVIADEVGMGKTRIAVELIRAVIESGGRVAILVPPGLGYQWQAELRDGGVEAPPILRSIKQYLSAWSGDAEDPQPWFRRQAVLVSHVFTNWRLSGKSESWRWALLPELYAHWRKNTTGRLPRGYNETDHLAEPLVTNAAKSICNAIPTSCSHPAWRLMDDLSKSTPWPGALDGDEYRRNQDLRPWLERAFGLGLGIFDLVIIDEAHKSRGTDTSLSRLICGVVLTSKEARRLAMTATPVELEVSQWQETLERIGIDPKRLEAINEAITDYANAVKRVRQCPSSEEARDEYRRASASFHGVLKDFLLRRDKREDPAVRAFAAHSGQGNIAYRHEKELVIEAASLAPAWRHAICAAEALSVAASNKDDPVLQRLRLTMGNGHGIAAVLDQMKRDERDCHQEEFDMPEPAKEQASAPVDEKRQARAQWWLNVMAQAFCSDEESLFEHPAILAAVDAIEEATRQGEKVLVFGRFTRPLKALVSLLNAREMLRRLETGRPWPQAKVSGNPSDSFEHSEWPAVKRAQHQLQCSIPLDEIDQRLKKQYDVLENRRKEVRRSLVKEIEEGLQDVRADTRSRHLFAAFKSAVNEGVEEGAERHPLALVSKALGELMGEVDENPSPKKWAEAFLQLIAALSDRAEGDTDGDGNLDPQEASKLWPTLEERLYEEYNLQQGGFARLMFGGTKQETRRMIQLAFNRVASFPKVLVAQSMVGREGLNLHTACRTVVLLHPEWNPGVVEQQLGRVDRVGSHWAAQLFRSIENGHSGDDLPRIEVHPVIFKGTYDEHNWAVLRDRWDDLRAQLHGIVIPQRLVSGDPDLQLVVDELAKAAPDFSPLRSAY